MTSDEYMLLSSGLDSLQSQRAVSTNVEGEITYPPTSSQTEGFDSAITTVKKKLANKQSQVTIATSK